MVSAWMRGLVVQAEVIHAVMMRETRTRFGAHRLGYLWALLDPILVILTFFVLFRLVGRPAPAGMDLFSFVATGVIPFRLFGNSAGRVAESIHGNQGLLYYPQVLPLDIAIARGLLEAATFSGVFIVLLGGHALAVQELTMDGPLLVIGGMAIASLLGTTVGLLFCGLAQLSNAVDRARQPILRPLFWISGVFFTAETLGGEFRRIALWNPIFHAVEMVRAGWFTSYGSQHADPAYALSCVAVLALGGLAIEKTVRRRVELTT